MKLKRTLIVLLAVLMLLSPLSLISSTAAPTFTLETSVYKWDAKEGKNVLSNEFSSNDILTLYISAPENIPLGGLQFVVNYDSESLKFNKNLSSYLPEDSKANLMINPANAGKIAGTLDTSKRDNQVSGDLFTFNFTVLTVKSEKTVSLTVDVIDAYDSSANHDPITVTTDSGKTVSLLTTDVPQSFIDLVKKLSKITIDSLEDITNAEVAFAKLTNLQKKAFKDTEWYEIFIGARAKYNLLLENAKLEELYQAAENFIKTNPILNKEIEKLTADDKAAVDKMMEAYKLLTENVKTKLSREIREKIPKIQERVDLLVESITNTADYKLSYSSLWETDEELVLMDAEDVINLVNEALLIYDTLDEISKQNLADKKAYIEALKIKLLDRIEKNAAQALIDDEIIEYQKIWLKVLSLSKFSVKLEDKTAIKLAMGAYEKLSEGAKAGLLSKYNNMAALLELLDYYAQLDDEKDDNASDTPSSDASQSSQSNNTQSTPLQDVSGTVSYITNTETVTQTVTETVTVTVPEYITQTITVPETQTVTETVTTEVLVKEYMEKPVARVIFWLFVNLFFAMVWGAFAYFYNKFLEKKLLPIINVREEE